MARPPEQIQAKALKLPERARAKLVGRLLRSFPPMLGMEAAVAQDWLDEAERRDEAMTRYEETGTPAHEVFRRIAERREG